MSDAAGAAAGDTFVDLHAHSTASDGALAPAKAVAAAHSAGLRAFALTDHDTLAGIPEAQASADGLGIELVAGVELSVHHGADEFHLLGLHVRNIEPLQQELEVIRGHRRTRAEQIVAKLQAAGLTVTLEAVLAEAGDGAIGRPHVARALIGAGQVRDMREAFDRWLAYGKPAYVDKERLDVAAGIAMVHRAGGIAVIAHLGSDGTRALVEALVPKGLDGIEVRHPSHSREDEQRLTALADHFGLVKSGGSDWHGAMHGARVLGAMKVPYAWMEAQRLQVEVRRRVA